MMSWNVKTGLLTQKF